MIQVTDPNLAWFPGSKKISKYFENIRPKIFRKKLRYAIFPKYFEIYFEIFRKLQNSKYFEINFEIFRIYKFADVSSHKITLALN